jgi:hypothetical protein
MAEFKKQYKVLRNESLNKLEAQVYFEINHEGWVPLGGADFASETHSFGKETKQVEYWFQTLWLPEPYWKEELEILAEEDTLLGSKPERLRPEEEEPEIYRDD